MNNYKLHKEYLDKDTFRELKGIVAKLPKNSDYFRDTESTDVLHFDNEKLNGIISNIINDFDYELKEQLGDYGVDEIAIFRPIEFKKNISSYLHHDNLGNIIRIWIALGPVNRNCTTRFLPVDKTSLSYRIVDFFERYSLRHKLNRRGFSLFLKIRDLLIEVFNKGRIVDFELNASDSVVWNANYIHRAKVPKTFFGESYFDDRSYLTLQLTNTINSRRFFDEGVRIVGFGGKKVEVNSAQLKDKLHMFANK